MQLYMQTKLGWRKTKYIEEMPPHIAEMWAKRTLPPEYFGEPAIAVVIRAAGPHARPSYITHQTINFDGIGAGEVMRAVKCKFGEGYPEQFRAWDSAGAMMKVNNNDMNICHALSASGNTRPASKNQVDSVVLPFIHRMISQ